jgi:hypothetical protein
MDDCTKRTKKVAYQPPAIKPRPDYSIKPRQPKKKARLDASQTALRVVETAIGGKLVENKRRSSR